MLNFPHRSFSNKNTLFPKKTVNIKIKSGPTYRYVIGVVIGKLGGSLDGEGKRGRRKTVFSSLERLVGKKTDKI